MRFGALTSAFAVVFILTSGNYAGATGDSEDKQQSWMSSPVQMAKEHYFQFCSCVAVVILVVFCFPGLVLNVIGFTATGIVKGSIAALMMSISAIQSGGGVAAGSLVAIFQSIGAVGLNPRISIVLVLMALFWWYSGGLNVKWRYF